MFDVECMYKGELFKNYNMLLTPSKIYCFVYTCGEMSRDQNPAALILIIDFGYFTTNHILRRIFVTYIHKYNQNTLEITYADKRYPQRSTESKILTNKSRK
jgi:hypothetical protein